MFDNRDHIDFAKENIPKLFRSIFIPTLLGMVFNMAFIITDGIFVGNHIGPHGLASINLIAPIMTIINGTGMMLGIGVSVVAAIHLAKNNIKAARINVTQSFIAGGMIGLLLATVFYSFPNTILRWVGVSEGLFASTKEYYLWFLPTCLLLLIQTLGMFVIRTDGSPKFAMISNIVPAVVNIIMDYVLIYPCDMALKGAALATDIGQACGVILVLYYMIFKTNTLKFYRVKFSRTSWKLSMRNIGYMIKVGFSGFLGELAISVLIMIGNIIFGYKLNDDGVAAWSIACYLFPLIYMTYSAIAQSAQPILSFNYGLKNKTRVLQTFKHSLLVAILVGAVITLVFAVFPQAIVRIFIDSDSMAFRYASEGLPYFAIGFIFMATNICVIGYLQSIEQARNATGITLLRGIIYMIAAFLWMPILLGNLGLWLAVPAAEILTVLTMLCFYKKAQEDDTPGDTDALLPDGKQEEE
ncbi:MAG: MATE family efflux transporter [Bacteroidales bacterium]|nr:MATE family efflux transporter [Bacteroidales bacterium]